MGKVKVIILGSAQDGGLPQIGGRSKYDKDAVIDNTKQRNAASIAILSEEGNCLLIDASPDIRNQHLILRNIPEYQTPRDNDEKPLFDGVLLTHAHIGHYAGILHLGKEVSNTREVSLYGTRSMERFLSSNAPWKSLLENSNLIFKHVNNQDDETKLNSFSPWEGLTVRPFLVPHRAEFTDTIGISINEKIIYIPDIDRWEEWEEEAFKEFSSHEICLLDGTFYTKEEIKARNINEIPHPSIIDSVTRFQSLVKSKNNNQFPRIIFTHLNHTNPLCDSSSEQFQYVINHQFEVANDRDVFEI